LPFINTRTVSSPVGGGLVAMLAAGVGACHANGPPSHLLLTFSRRATYSERADEQSPDLLRSITGKPHGKALQTLRKIRELVSE
jgi:hypothetical protein